MTDLIQWPRAKYWDKCWNPVIGCKPCSPACEHCYAEAWAKRFGKSFKPHDTKQRPPRSGIVFCGNMTDLFGEFMYPWNAFEDIDVTETTENLIADCSSKKAIYLWLTKRVKMMLYSLTTGKASFIDDEGDTHFVGLDKLDLSNHYFGFTAENQEWFNRRVDYAASIPLIHKQWLSAEPLLGPIEMCDMVEMFKWVAVGCESGPNRRPCKLEWIESIVEQCRAANVPVFVKQLDLDGKCERDITKFPEHLQIRQVPWWNCEKGDS